MECFNENVKILYKVVNFIKASFEVYIQLEIDYSNNLKCFNYEPNSKNIFECLININVVKN